MNVNSLTSQRHPLPKLGGLRLGRYRPVLAAVAATASAAALALLPATSQQQWLALNCLDFGLFLSLFC